ncbi:extracellular calcium-sensing receptor-like [Rhinatrema bivittatum]|uniref:extracellular calcium-sensing receptor-like n=1 Tax=Rhinatrema bivittatum TaxID=194408 RepID=UPI00112DDE80|nr:extracellular calcium-sensing receptor-like [Rhinatrema bivittatum]
MALLGLMVLLAMPPPLYCALSPGCTLRSQKEVGFAQDGDILIGGIIPVHLSGLRPDNQITGQPDLCDTLDTKAYGWVQAIVFSINEINQDQSLLPNISLGFQIYDTCDSITRALRGTTWMLTGQENPILNYQCQSQASLAAIIGESSSTSSISMARVLGLYRFAQISYFSTSPILSNKFQFPSFFRMLPSDDIQARGLAQMVVRFGWEWVGLLSSAGDYGTLGSQILKVELLKLGICIAFHKTFPMVSTAMELKLILEMVKRSTAKIILVYSSYSYFMPVIEELSRANITAKIWIISDGWSSAFHLLKRQYAPILAGAIGFAVHEGEMPGFKEFLLKLHPSTSPSDIFIKPLWKEIFRCHWPNSENHLTTLGNMDVSTPMTMCTGAEKLKVFNSQMPREFDMSISYNVYNAVYSVAHALQDMHSCVLGKGPFVNHTCADIWNFKPWQLLYYMKKVHFMNKMREEMYFDNNGDPPAVYDIINWQPNPDGSIQAVKVGRFDSKAPKGQELSINMSSIRWNTQHTEVPRSVCSESCGPGYRKAAQQGQPLCCFDCIPCAEGEISNVRDSAICWQCASEQWPNERRSECVPKKIEYLSYQEVVGIILTVVATFGSITTAAILCVFIKYRDTPIAKANNRELSFLLLGALMLSFLCSLLFIGDPQQITCLLRQPAFGIIFVLCVSCVLAKTIMVVIAFNATKPNSNLRGWVGPRVPIVTVSACTFIQVFICIIWLLICPPFPEKNMKLKTGIIIWQCNECSDVAFWCMLGYMGFLACVSFLVAFLARKLPDSFNEAKWITFSMLVFLSVWLSFIPGYLSTQGKNTVAVEVFGIISSSAGILVCIFLPKCYIILLRPDMNTREQLLGKGVSEMRLDFFGLPSIPVCPMALLGLVVLLAMTPSQGCALQSQKEVGFVQDGDIQIGGIIPVHLSWMKQENLFAGQPDLCHR